MGIARTDGEDWDNCAATSTQASQAKCKKLTMCHVRLRAGSGRRRRCAGRRKSSQWRVSCLRIGGDHGRRCAGWTGHSHWRGAGGGSGARGEGGSCGNSGGGAERVIALGTFEYTAPLVAHAEDLCAHSSAVERIAEFAAGSYAY